MESMSVNRRAVGESPAPPRHNGSATVHPFPFSGDDTRLVESLRQGYPPAVAHFYVIFADKVHRLLFRILGRDSELEDAVHDTFVRALESIHTLRDPRALSSWVIGIAIYAARIRIQKRRRRRWLQLLSPSDMPEPIFFDRSPDVGEAVHALSRVLDLMPTDERIAVVLRLAEGMTLSEAADACGVSLSTFKRRFGRGQKTLYKLVALEPALQTWLKEDHTAELEVREA
jgi:RNA polymerase sigma-70 factor (ECF subfamily)